MIATSVSPRFAGARWWTFDFHTHTPASADFNKGIVPAPQIPTPRAWLLAYMQARIDCVAVTDHNSAEWVEKLQTDLKAMAAEKPAGFRHLVLFPGAEITVNGGIHLLAVLDPSTSKSDIDKLLGAVGSAGPETVTTKSLSDVVDEIHKRGGIAIPAHVDGASGLFKEEKGGTLGQVLTNAHITAYECCVLAYAPPGQYTERKLRWTSVLGSDSHHMGPGTGPKFPGSHYTWVKMSKPCIEGLRLALLDGELSTRRSDAPGGDPNAHSELVIRDLHVHQAKYVGREKTIQFEFSPWLSAIIGGRGTGKSSIVEFLRLVLGRQGHLPKDMEKDFENYFAASAVRGEPGLLTPQAEIIAHYEKDGTVFRLSWSQSTNQTTMEEEQMDGTWKAIEGDLAQRFPARIYSQKQIFHFAKKPRALLEVVDDATEVDGRGWQIQYEEQASAFRSTRAKVREIELRFKESKDLRGELDDVERRIKVLAASGYAEVLKAYEKRMVQSEAVRAFSQQATDNLGKTRALLASLAPPLLDAALFEGGQPNEDAVAVAASNLAAWHAALAAEIATATDGFDAKLKEWEAARDGSAWKASVASATDAYQKVISELKESDGLDPRGFEGLIQRRNQINERLTALEGHKLTLGELHTKEGVLLADLFERRKALTTKRQAFLRDVLADDNYVRISVIQYGDADHSVQELRRILRRDSGYDKEFGSRADGGILGAIYVDAKRQDTTFEFIQSAKAGISALIADEATTLELGKKFVTHLRTLTPDDLDALTLWFPEDSLAIEYSPTGDGKNFQPIEAGSPGQMTAALLAFLLSYSKQPLILDQPEDDLDNLMIYNLIVSQVRERKGRRQVILVTHNPNLVVNADAEQVIALKTQNGNTRIATSGSLQQLDVREMVCSVMEGGRDAFEQRYRRIVLEART